MSFPSQITLFVFLRAYRADHVLNTVTLRTNESCRDIKQVYTDCLCVSPSVSESIKRIRVSSNAILLAVSSSRNGFLQQLGRS